MPTAYTNTEPAVAGTGYTAAETTTGAKPVQVEPPGAGIGAGGDYLKNGEIDKEYGRGAGDPKTQYTISND